MDSRVENYIIDRKIEGATLRSIQEELLEKFDFKTSKQNIHKFYNRWCEKEAHRINDSYIIEDVINVVARKAYLKDCAGLPLLNYMSGFKLKKYIEKGEDDLEELRSQLENKVVNLYADGYDPEDISKELAYKGIEMDEILIKRIIKRRVKGVDEF